MIGFNIGEIFNSVIYAFAFGVIFSVAFSLCRLVRGMLASILDVTSEFIKFSKIFPLPNFKKFINPKKNGAVFSFLSIIFFTLGFILISYLSLDGTIRIYMLIVSFASFYLSNFTFCEILSKILLCILNLFLKFLCLIFRIIASPIKMILKRRNGKQKQIQ